MRFRIAIWAILLAPLVVIAEPGEALEKIKAVGPEGKGNEAAAKAWKEVVEGGTDALIPTLAAFMDDNARVNNWLRSAVNAIVDDARKAKKPLPEKALVTFLNDQSRNGEARRIAFDLFAEMNPERSASMLPAMVKDPSRELRRLAIATYLERAEKLEKEEKKEAAKEVYAIVLPDARDEDQIEVVVQALKKYGTEVDLPKHYGFVQNWWVVAPFDNRKGIGFDKAYPPEKSVDLSAKYEGMNEKEITWKQYSTDDPHGQVDLNMVLDKHKGAVAYAFAVIESPKAQLIDIRAGSITALKIYLNGKELFGREEYHHGMRLDQHNTTGTLKKGRNELLIKVCQNEQEEPWAQKWQFQVRLCDKIGGAVPFTAVRKLEENGGTE